MLKSYMDANLAAYRLILITGVMFAAIALILICRGQISSFSKGLGLALLGGAILEMVGGAWFAYTLSARSVEACYLTLAASLDRLAGFERSLLVQAGLLALISAVVIFERREWVLGVALGAALHLAFTIAVDAAAIGRERVLIENLDASDAKDYI